MYELLRVPEIEIKDEPEPPEIVYSLDVKPYPVVIESAIGPEILTPAFTTRVTFIEEVALTESVAVIVIVYVPAPTVFGTVNTVWLEMFVVFVIPVTIGDEVIVKVLLPVPWVAVTVSVIDIPAVVVRVEKVTVVEIAGLTVITSEREMEKPAESVAVTVS
jgi:hypothetical protein